MSKKLNINEDIVIAGKNLENFDNINGEIYNINHALGRTVYYENEDWSTRAGFSCTHFEGVGMDTKYNIPSSYCTVICYNHGANRGTALAIQWIKEPRMWINSKHDDTGSNTWHGWKEVSLTE